MSEELKRDFKGIWIPKEVYLNGELNWTDKILLVEIDSLDNEKGCFASNAYFAEFLSLSETSVSVSIAKLKKLGLIEQTSFDGRKRILKSLTLRQPKVCLPENLNHSNTLNKTLNNNLPIGKGKTRTGFGLTEATPKKKTLAEVITDTNKDPDVIKALKEFIEHYKGITKIYPSIQQFTKQMEELYKISGGDKKQTLYYIELAIRKGWRGFYKEGTFNNQAGIDNMANQEKEVIEESDRNITEQEF